MAATRRRDVLHTLRAATEPMSTSQLAQRLGVHANTVRFHLETLVAGGQVERAETDGRGPGRPPLLFRAVRRMDPAGPRHYQLLAEALAHGLAGAPEPAARASEAGQAWGARLASAAPEGEPVARLTGLLSELGFDPELRQSDGETQVGLRHCPFLEAAEAHAEVVCPVHLGLMRGALEAWQAPITIDRLEPFVEPDLCLAHVAPRGAA